MTGVQTCALPICFRNPQGIAFRPGTGDVYLSENGPWHSDEVTKVVNGGNGGWDPRDNVNGRPACPDGYCGYSPNQMGAMPPAERAKFMPMTDTKAYPNAMKPAWNNNGMSQGMCGSVFITGKQWKEWEGRLAVGYAGIGDRKSTRLNSSHIPLSRMPSSA